MDMVHSIYYVAGLYQDRLEDWRKEDFAETSSEVLPVMQRDYRVRGPRYACSLNHTTTTHGPYHGAPTA
ncbi:hypothetical protein WJX79_009054 [Trebouxia sp. C0005]